jgi:hypothetical protein
MARGSALGSIVDTDMVERCPSGSCEFPQINPEPRLYMFQRRLHDQSFDHRVPRALS